MDKFSREGGAGLASPRRGHFADRGIDRIEYIENLEDLGNIDNLETLDRLGELGTGGRQKRAKYLKVGMGITTNAGLWGWREWCNFALFFERWFIELYGVLYLRRIGNATKTTDHGVRKARQSAKQGRGSIDIQQSQSVDYQTSTHKSKNRKSSTEHKQKKKLRYWYEKIYLHNDVGLGVRYGSACR